MTVPASLKELEKIEIIRLPDGNYHLDYAVTATQKEILKAYEMNEKSVREQVIKLNQVLHGMKG